MKNTSLAKKKVKGEKIGYVLVHRLTRSRVFSDPPHFTSCTQAALYALSHDLHVDVVPAVRDLLGYVVPE